MNRIAIRGTKVQKMNGIRLKNVYLNLVWPRIHAPVSAASGVAIRFIRKDWEKKSCESSKALVLYPGYRAKMTMWHFFGDRHNATENW